MNSRYAALIFIGLLTGTGLMNTWLEAAVLVGAIVVVVWTTMSSTTGHIRALGVRLRPFLYFAFIALVFGGMSQESPLFTLGIFSWGGPALDRAAMGSLRLIALGVAAGWLTLKVDSATMIAGLWSVSQRVRGMGIDLSPILFGMAIAIRFLPILQEEARWLRMSWEARGADLLRGPLGRIRYALGLVIPLLAAALRRAEAFATAMELRVAAVSGKEMGGSNADVFWSLRKDTAITNGHEKKTFSFSPTNVVAVGAAWLPVGFKLVNWLS